MSLDRILLADATWSNRLSLANRPSWLRYVAAVLAHSGDSWLWLAGLAVLYAVGDSFWKSWSLRMGLVILVLAGLVLTVKFIFRRPRPEGEWGAIYRKTDPHSFPSGHAARSVLIAVLSLGWGPPWLAVPLLFWAPLVSLARVAMGVHFLSDVVVGAGIGICAGLSALTLL